MPTKSNVRKVTAAGLLATLGIIYGDIGTSPLYVMKAIIGNHTISEALVLGAISCIFWTLTLQTTLKYVILTLRADNKGEGGIFSLYALVRKTKRKFLVVAAIVGGSALLADGIIAPPISISAAVEGLGMIDPGIPTIPIVIGILAALFVIQRYGISFTGGFFGPMMLIWFCMLSVLGLQAITANYIVLNAVNPVYAFHLIRDYPGGLWLLGAVFLCTTGAEALYSDLGRCGKKYIRISWIFVKTSLLLSYFGQGAWLLQQEGKTIGNINPFYGLMSDWFLPFGIAIATLSAVIASQALIVGAYTLINEAIRLNFWPKVKVVYPTDLRGQLYIPSVNWWLLLGCVSVTLFFRESSNMEAAYGLAIIVTMLMTTVILSYYLYKSAYPVALILLIFFFYSFIEFGFLVANLTKFAHGGWVTVLLGGLLSLLMWVLYQSRKIRNKLVEFIDLKDYLPLLDSLSKDTSIPKYSTHLVYLTSANNPEQVEEKIIYSILQRSPKRADIYWLVHVDVLDEPYTQEFKVTELEKDNVFRIDFRIGFRIDPRVNLMFRQVVEELVKNNEVDITSRYSSLKKRNMTGDFRFVVMEKFLSLDNDLPVIDKLIMDTYFFVKKFALPEEKAFGLDTSSVAVEKVPLIVKPLAGMKLTRMK